MRLQRGLMDKGDRFLFCPDILRKLIALFEIRGWLDMVILTLVSWEFLLRVTSEAIHIEAGEESNFKSLPYTRRSALSCATRRFACG